MKLIILFYIDSGNSRYNKLLPPYRENAKHTYAEAWHCMPASPNRGPRKTFNIRCHDNRPRNMGCVIMHFLMLSRNFLGFY